LTEVAQSHPNRELRKEAIFWLSQQGGPEALRTLDALFAREVDMGVLKQVLFAYTQLPEGVGRPRLMETAHRHAQVEVRKEAIFWLSQDADETVLELFDELLAGDEPVEVQKQLVFALSQLPDEVGVPRLIELARSGRQAQVRKEAIFWLGQHDDPRARAALLDLVQGK
jgi:HEAT repeat protein